MHHVILQPRTSGPGLQDNSPGFLPITVAAPGSGASSNSASRRGAGIVARSLALCGGGHADYADLVILDGSDSSGARVDGLSFAR